MTATFIPSPVVADEQTVPPRRGSGQVPDSRKVLAGRALDWVVGNLDRFEPFQGQLDPGPRKKALTELALICLCLHRQPAFASDARVAKCLGLVLQTYRNPVYRERLFRQNEGHADDFATDALVPVVLHACGLLEDADEWRVIQNLIDHSNIPGRSRGPDRVLELIHVLDLGGFRYRLPSPATCVGRLLCAPVNIIRITDEESYNITHTVFYLSDFGMRCDLGIAAAARQQLSWLVEHLLGVYVRDGNQDLVGELLVCCHCLQHTRVPHYSIGWQTFLDAQRPDGAVPGPRYDPAHEATWEAVRRPEYIFRHCYHTTLVAALAGALCQAEGDDDGHRV